ncbi:GNAT family N-acetyltransferase [Actinomyces radicidentis]|uniref:GNAT family N-acetyltransferase n=1 Tax=Actinomyces radicidentis TaxID=111015 RepID=UPI0026E0322B|nr:GNAT family N-acetyltransferase [Actinomyces radicidentis]
MHPEDAGAARRAQYEGWRDTYVRPDGVSAAWLEEVWRPRLSETGIAEFAAEVAEGQHCPSVVQLVAEVDDGAGPEVVGLAIGLAPEDGPQELRVLYVAHRARGRGAGSALLDAVLARMDPARP